MDMNKLNEYTKKQEEICIRNDYVSPIVFQEYGVNRGLRDENGKGVLTGLTHISDIVSSHTVNG